MSRQTAALVLNWLGLAAAFAGSTAAAVSAGAAAPARQCAEQVVSAPAFSGVPAASELKLTYDYTQARQAYGPITAVTLLYKPSKGCLDGLAITFGPAVAVAVSSSGAPAAEPSTVDSATKTIGAEHAAAAPRTLKLPAGHAITRVDLKASASCIQWLKLMTDKGASVSLGAMISTSKTQTLAAPPGAYLYTINGRGSLANAGPLQQLQFVWAACMASAVQASVSPPGPPADPPAAGGAAPAFFLSSCRASAPNKCDLSAASGGACEVLDWQTDACRATGLGDNMPSLRCQGVQTTTSYNKTVYTYNGTAESTPDCTNLACKLQKPGCTTSLAMATYCWGVVVAADPAAPLSLLARARLGYPCLDVQSWYTPDPQPERTNFNVLQPGQEGVYAKGSWQACECTEPAGIDWLADNEVRSLLGEHYWATHCEARDLLPPVAAAMCSAWTTTKTAAQWAADLEEKRALRARVTDLGYLSSPAVLKQRALEQQQAARGEAMRNAWCKVIPIAGLLLPFTLVFPPLTMALAMSFDSC